MRNLFQYSRKFLCTNNGTLLKNLTDKWRTKFQEGKVQDEEFFFRCILSKLLKVKFSTTLDHNTIYLTTDQVQSFEKSCECRIAGMPVQYIVGEWDFKNLVLKMVPPVFIPRPETESFVDLILSKQNINDNFNFLEIGCGTGAISLSILKVMPNSKCIAVDKSSYATELTIYNAEKLGLKEKINVLCYGITKEAVLPHNVCSSFDAIISNPPYVKTNELAKLATELLYEDIQALDGGHDGMKVIKNICKMATNYLKPDGKLWMEVDEKHPEILKEFIEKNVDSLEYINTYKDLFGKDRFVEIRRKN